MENWKEVPMMATDTGYSYLKAAWNEGEKVKLKRVPSAISLHMKKSGALSGKSPDIEYRGSYYFAGEDALKYGLELINTYSEDFSVLYTPILLYKLMSDEKVLPKVVCYSIALHEIGKEIVVIDPQSGKILKGKKQHLLKKFCSHFTINGQEFEFETHIFPQGVGIWYDVGHPEDALIVDIGDRTVDIVPVVAGEFLAHESIGLADEGTMKIVERIITIVEEITGRTPDLTTAKSWLEKDKIRFAGKEIDLVTLKREITVLYIGELIKKILSRSLLRKLYDRAGQIIFAGGGANLIPEELKEAYSIYVPPQPEFSNVRGFFKQMQSRVE